MLQSISVCKKYLNKIVVDNVSMTLEPGHVYAMLGPNGSGKTTWMKMVAGLVKPSFGEIQFDDKPVDLQSKKEIAYMPTEPFFYDWMTVEDVGKYYNDFFEDFSLDRYAQLISAMNLEMDLKLKTLSSGMMAKLKIAATMGRDAKVYMLDEPLNGIDLLSRDKVIKAIVTYASDDKILIISSHLVEELEAVADTAIFFCDGKFIGMYELEAMRFEEGMSVADKYRELYAKTYKEAEDGVVD
ncbi:MAG: ABC transporter ATP-binding protein [Pseudobutyrivibrio sp.]|nr:ABC transporter ATP-binding protein [Pseudobutyrivibrio sp.]